MSRVTYGLFLELSVDKLIPGFFDSLREFSYGESLDPGAFKLSLEFGRVEIEDVGPGQATGIELAVNAIWRRLADDFAERNGILDWQKFGRMVTRRVEDAPQPTGTFGATASPAIACPKCESPMVARTGRGGSQFYGCSKYPGCGGTRRMSR